MTRIRSPFLLVAAALAAAVVVPSLSAQVCLGLPAFRDASVHLNAAAEFPDSARSYAGGIGAGVQDGVFLNLGGGVVTYQGIDERAIVGFGELGWQVPLGRAQLCPVAGGYLGSGPDDDFGLSIRTHGASGGIALGVPIGLGVVDAIPSAAFKIEYVSQTAEQEDVGSTTETDQSGLLDLGLGLVYRGRFTVRPLAHIPFAADGAEPSFGVFASVIVPIPVPGMGGP